MASRALVDRRVRVGAIELSCLVCGEGGRPLLLLHGYTGAKEDFATVAPTLAAAGWHVVAPDHAGHGASDAPEGEHQYSLARFAEDAAALTDALGWDRFVLGGHSMGGMVAQVLALSAPERVDALVLIDTHHGAVSVDPALVDWAVELVRNEGIDAIADVMAEMEGPLATQAWRDLVAREPEHKVFGDQKLRASSPHMYVALAQELVAQTDRLASLSSLPMPALVIVGEQDEPFVAASERMAATLPAGRLAVVRDAGHSPQFEAPDAFREALHLFLEEIA